MLAVLAMLAVLRVAPGAPVGPLFAAQPRPPRCAPWLGDDQVGTGEQVL
jgi:hypothetical protein